MRWKAASPYFVAMIVIAGVAFAAMAQETNSPGQRVPPVNRRPQPPAGPARLAEGLGSVVTILTEEQRVSLAQALQSQREQVRELEVKIRAARGALFEAGLGGRFDEETVRKQAQVLAGLQVERTVLSLRALSEVKPPLSSEQIERMKNVGPVAPGRVGPRAGIGGPGGERRRALINTNRDQNDLPPKQ